VAIYAHDRRFHLSVPAAAEFGAGDFLASSVTVEFTAAPAGAVAWVIPPRCGRSFWWIEQKYLYAPGASNGIGVRRFVEADVAAAITSAIGK